MRGRLLHTAHRLSLFVAVLLAAAVSTGGAGAGPAATPPQNTTPPAIGGTAQLGSKLTASAGSWNGTTPISFSFAWNRCNHRGGNCRAIHHATSSTYVVVSDDVGRTLRLQVTATNSAGSAQAQSAATAIVTRGDRPANRTSPTISGTAVEGNVLTASSGSWDGTTPIAYSYQWRRCDAHGNQCGEIDGAGGASYRLTADDVARTVRVRVDAQNIAGSGDARSDPTAPVDGPPALDHRPSISGSASVGGRLVTGTGSWRSTTRLAFAFQWLRCDAGGNNCGPIAGATGASYTVTGADAGHALTAQVRAQNARGTTTTTARGTSEVGSPLPPSASVPVATVSPPDRLVVDRISWSPQRIHSRAQALVGRFHVSEVLHGRSVSGALVYAVGVPFGWLSQAQEVLTGADGWATVVFAVRPALPLRPGTFVVVFVRARKPGDNLLAGVSSRRLVSVQVG